MAVAAFLKVYPTEKPDKLFKGNCQITKYKEWIEITDFDHSFSLPVSSATPSSNLAPVSRCDHDPAKFSKFNDSATDELMRACWTGQCIDLQLHAFRALGTADLSTEENKFLLINLEKAFITEFSISPLEEEGGKENFSVVYNYIQYVFAERDFKEGKLNATKRKAVEWSWLDNKVLQGGGIAKHWKV